MNDLELECVCDTIVFLLFDCFFVVSRFICFAGGGGGVGLNVLSLLLLREQF